MRISTLVVLGWSALVAGGCAQPEPACQATIDAWADDDGDGGDGGRPAWAVELRARLGPLARSKRLRMERTVHDTERHVAVFERVERDGRHHSPWVLRAEVVGDGEGSALHMHLHYGGALWTGGLMERALTDQITAGRERLSALVSA